MEEFVEKGKVKNIGVSNFSKGEIETLVKESSTVCISLGYKTRRERLIRYPGSGRPPNGRPSLPPTKWIQRVVEESGNPRRAIQSTGKHERLLPPNRLVQEVAHMMRVIDQPILSEIGKKYNKSPVQVVLARGINNGRSVIPRVLSTGKLGRIWQRTSSSSPRIWLELRL
jgi:hypothetical protein